MLKLKRLALLATATLAMGSSTAFAQTTPEFVVGEVAGAAGSQVVVPLSFNADATIEVVGFGVDLTYRDDILTPVEGDTGNPNSPINTPPAVQGCLASIPAAFQTQFSSCAVQTDADPTDNFRTIRLFVRTQTQTEVLATTAIGSITFNIDATAADGTYPITGAVVEATGPGPTDIAASFNIDEGAVAVAQTFPIIVGPTTPPTFGQVVQNTSPNPTQVVTISNDADATDPLTIQAVALADGTTPISVSSENCTTNSPLAAGGECQVTLELDATAAIGTYNDMLNVTSDDQVNSPLQIAVDAEITDVPPEADIAADPVDFGTPQVGATAEQTLTVNSVGGAQLDIGTIAAPDAPFSIIQDNCSEQSLPALTGTCTVQLALSTANAGNFMGTLSIPSNDPNENPLVVNLMGTVLPPTVVTNPAAPGPLMIAMMGESATVELTNNGDTPLTGINPVLGDTTNFSIDTTVANACGTELPAMSSCVVAVTYIGMQPATTQLTINTDDGSFVFDVRGGQTPIAIPTISQWSMMIVASLLAMVAAFGFRRKQS